jgi:hypothetical protein
MQRGLAHPDTGTASRAGARIRPAPAPLASRTMKQASCSSTDHRHLAGVVQQIGHHAADRVLTVCNAVSLLALRRCKKLQRGLRA